MEQTGGIGQGARRVLPQLRPDQPAQRVQRVPGERAEEEGVVPPRQLVPDREGLLVPLHVLEVVALEESPDADPWMERQGISPQHLQLLLRAVPRLPKVDDPGVEIAGQARGHQLRRRDAPAFDEGIPDHDHVRRAGVLRIPETVAVVLITDAVPHEIIVGPVQVEQRGIDEVSGMAPRLGRGRAEEHPEIHQARQHERLQEPHHEHGRDARHREPLRQLAPAPPRDGESDSPGQQIEREDPRQQIEIGGEARARPEVDPQGAKPSQKRQPERSTAGAAPTGLDHHAFLRERPNSGTLEFAPGKHARDGPDSHEPGPASPSPRSCKTGRDGGRP